MAATQADHSTAALRLPEFRCMLVASACATLASRAAVTVLGYQIYAITKDVLALGLLGLIEVIPAVGLALFGGHFADKHDRRRIILVTQATSVFCAIAFALTSLQLDGDRMRRGSDDRPNPAAGAVTTALPAAAELPTLTQPALAPAGGLLAAWPLYAIVFVIGIARGFADPALSAFEAQVVPRELYVNASVWLSTTWFTGAIVGPALAGFSFAFFGAAPTYAAAAALFAIAWLSIYRIAPKPIPDMVEGESIWRSIGEGIRFVFRNQALVGSMALDLFAVLFGGAVALMPVFATEILHVDKIGLGFLNAAPFVGSLLVMLWSTRYPPIRHAGRNLFVCVAGFGVSIIVFALSQNFALSLIALAASGAFDGVSVVIRKAIVRVATPEHMRARVSSVSWIFISSSNELGTFESGVAAKLLGTVPSVWMGGVVTLLVVAVTAVLAPKLLRLRLDDIGPDASDGIGSMMPVTPSEAQVRCAPTTEERSPRG